ncbi:hypothetical protein ACWGNU_21830 [Paenibacillus lautus]
MTSKAIRCTIIEELRQEYPLKWLLQLADVSRAGYDAEEVPRWMRANSKNDC